MLIKISQCRHPTSASKLRASHKTIVSNSGRHNDLLRIGWADFSISIIQYLIIGEIFIDWVFSVRHKIDSHSLEIIHKIIALPTSVTLLHLPICLKVPKCEKLFFYPYKCKFFNVIIYLLPHHLCIYPKFKQPSVLETNK